MAQLIAPGESTLVPDGAPGSSSLLLRATLDGLCVPGVLNVVAQPIVRLADLVVVGYEALTRMPVRPRHGPDWWLERASELRMRSRVEIACWRAISEHGAPPDEALLFLNVSPATLAEPGLLALRNALPNRVVIEVTEQEAVADYMRLRTDLVPWLSTDARLAIDDTGSGHSSLRHVIELSPDFLKIDRSLVSAVDRDRNRRALLRSLVAFASEVGCTVIAEGVETIGELETLRDADVHLAQGFLFGRPARPWPAFEVDTVPPASEAARSGSPARARSLVVASEREEERLRLRLASAPDATAACEAIVEHLFRRGNLMPSIYLERRGQLRCIAQRGLWQVLDGMTATSGITGTTWATGQATFVACVRAHKDYLEAIPGVMAEACVPIICEGQSVGALNVESLSTLSPEIMPLLERCARLLTGRLTVIGWGGSNTAWQRAARASVTISGLAPEGDAASGALAALCQAAGMDSAALIEHGDDRLVVSVARGPLERVLSELPVAELGLLTALVEGVSSCYTGHDATGRGFIGTESLRALARAVVVLPLRAGGSRLATVVLAHSRPRALSGDDVEPLELVAAHFAATLSAASLVARLRRQAREDHLTKLGNRAAFEELLDIASMSPDQHRSAIILDIDHFKLINDELGHIVGDEALCVLAEQLSRTFAGLEIFRYGGDEFAVLLEDTHRDRVLDIARSLCVAARDALGPYGSSATAGFAIDEQRTAPRELFARADEALLWAKRHARGTATDVAAIA